MLLGFGCTFIVGLQALVNIGVTTSLLPNKGLPLPFISYGGSNLFFCLICIGILINIYRQGKEEGGIGQTAMMVRVRHLYEFLILFSEICDCMLTNRWSPVSRVSYCRAFWMARSRGVVDYFRKAA